MSVCVSCMCFMCFVCKKCNSQLFLADDMTLYNSIFSQYPAVKVHIQVFFYIIFYKYFLLRERVLRKKKLEIC